MLTVLSPAKKLDLGSPLSTRRFSDPRMGEEANQLASIMADKSPEEIGQLMSISDALADLNHARFQDWDPSPNGDGGRAAVLTFAGDVYQGMDLSRFTERDFTHAQKHLRILSGLYGVLRPLDRIQPHRLEMGTKLATNRGRDLYQFWGASITGALNEDLKGRRSPAVVNLASKEYFNAVLMEKLEAAVITPVFKDMSRGEYRVVSFWAKRARGAMAAWIVLNRVNTRAVLRSFDVAGYRYDPANSTPTGPVFLRDHG